MKGHSVTSDASTHVCIDETEARGGTGGDGEVAQRPKGRRRAPLRAADVLLTIVMPAYNEAETIRRAVDWILETEYPCEIELIVVDDGSSDSTLEEIADVEDERFRVVSHPRNLGKGAALMSGLAVAKGTHLLPFDADLEYEPSDIERLLQPILNGQAEVVYGTRLFGLNTRYHSFRYKLGNRATTLAANLLYDSAVTDMHTCFKLVPTRLLRQMPLTELGFGLDSEITANVLRAGYRPFEVPIAYYARSHAEGKKIRWRDGVHCLSVLTRVRMQPNPADRPPAVRPAVCPNCGYTMNTLGGTVVKLGTRGSRALLRRRASS